MGCISSEVLVRFVTERNLSPRLTEKVCEHLLSCSSCLGNLLLILKMAQGEAAHESLMAKYLEESQVPLATLHFSWREIQFFWDFEAPARARVMRHTMCCAKCKRKLDRILRGADPFGELQ